MQEISLCKKQIFSIKDFFSQCDQIRRKLQIWSHLLKKSLMENFIFCDVFSPGNEFKIQCYHNNLKVSSDSHQYLNQY